VDRKEDDDIQMEWRQVPHGAHHPIAFITAMGYESDGLLIGWHIHLKPDIHLDLNANQANRYHH
jgi:hypothetical protein